MKNFFKVVYNKNILMFFLYIAPVNFENFLGYKSLKSEDLTFIN